MRESCKRLKDWEKIAANKMPSAALSGSGSFERVWGVMSPLGAGRFSTRCGVWKLRRASGLSGNRAGRFSMRATLEVLGEAVCSPLSILHTCNYGLHVCNLTIPKRAKRPTRCWFAYDFTFVIRGHLAARVSPWNLHVSGREGRRVLCERECERVRTLRHTFTFTYSHSHHGGATSALRVSLGPSQHSARHL